MSVTVGAKRDYNSEGTTQTTSLLKKKLSKFLTNISPSSALDTQDKCHVRIETMDTNVDEL